jgi:hypothetical protein
MVKIPSVTNTRFSLLAKIGLWLLPWLPLTLLFLAVWDRYFKPKWVLAGKLSMDGLVMYSEQEQLAQAYPHWWLFETILVVAKVSFVIACILFVIAFFRRRSHVATPTI